MFRAGGGAWRSCCLWGLPSRVVIVEVKGGEMAGEVGPAESLKHPTTHTFRSLSCILEVGAGKGSEQGRTGPTKASPWTERRG